MKPGSERLCSYLPCMLRTAVLIRWSLQDGALLAAAVRGVLVGLHLPPRGVKTKPLNQWAPGSEPEGIDTACSLSSPG